MRDTLKREKKVRLTVDLPPPFYKRLSQLEHLVEASTKANLIRDALKLYETIARMALDGYEFYAAKDGRQERIVFLGSIPPNQEDE